MDFTEVAAIVDRYRRTDLNREVDPKDEMYNSDVNFTLAFPPRARRGR